MTLPLECGGRVKREYVPTTCVILRADSSAPNIRYRQTFAGGRSQQPIVRSDKQDFVTDLIPQA